ncbi:similar to Saccharomyces cerevisiae YNL131W TOM22 Component of the TOM (translocase of outer mitochondrial membrane) complex responsible for initial import of mitochondrially directed proteins [Maudiozyma barnettii]|uniref:Similar to Saccharomyces cerevisiae YNL131W TOM22 Component of the TOM (Translocase of outer mitochondrial membrane) complex responsible for initial import of mitochondrially directed proteins n=1 Tax=Maudiozyma barnettii TaxID=61262 RepID=A0A8H2VBN3_9SACH|nr:Tom22p [Kazachstania barnettii]CAB4252307.1 similar to Saccharomyces cerevisiae YNL131W TOM22 Component of the TOM (translocase of outer mitochondrial membrane) complex responsible for initial import of mitochondrially directed proteins [Kazachstania barnettii]CAD1779033.1 similar to Saccharomyces cerevisiae YNL131W TOM22 Component of the TOM (translocase of outer mitochondrial membrane) complex responsible for initial import of mitochondrially directed proteins [Kazachstania barnettii]
MVELTEIKDESNGTVETPQTVPSEPLNTAETKEAVAEEENEEDEEDSDFDDDFDENETFFERIVALKDIVSPKQRQTVCGFFTSTTTFFKSAFAKGGSLTWALTTSALLLGVPLSLSILAEQQLIEMEKTFDLQKDANDLLGTDASAPATAA